MKRETVRKMLAGMLAAGMVFGMGGCGGQGAQQDSAQSSSSQPMSEAAEETPVPTEKSLERMQVTVTAPANEQNEAGSSPEFDQLVEDINEYTNMDFKWSFSLSDSYYDGTDLQITSGNVPDIFVIYKGGVFNKAAEEGLFWDLTDYIDDYDNLATIPEGIRANASINGRLYGIPRSRTYARNGMGYRKDWQENLNLEDPETLEDFEKMLYEFTYGDPDGNGVNDTVGLYITPHGAFWNQMAAWFGVPNSWGIDENGDLIPAHLTEEYKTALRWFCEMYSLGVINLDFRDLDVSASTNGMKAGLGGVCIDVLDNIRKINTYFEDEGLSGRMALAPGVDVTGQRYKILPTDGYNGLIAISTRNIKTEEQLRRVLQALNDLNDGTVIGWVDSGYEGKTYSIDENGYKVSFSEDEQKAAGVTDTKYREGFNQVIAYFQAPENATQPSGAPSTDPVRLQESQMYKDNIQYCVTNYGASYTSATQTEKGSALSTIINDARFDYITGIIDEAGLEEALNTWLRSGGQDVIDEMNALYHAAGN